MSNPGNLADSICAEYSSREQPKENGVATLRWTSTPTVSPIEESYSCSLEGGTVTVHGKNCLSSAFGCSQLSTALAAGHAGEWLGLQSASFPLRPLWLGGTRALSLAEGVKVAIPEVADGSSRWGVVCESLVQYGYNAVVFGARSDLPVTGTVESTDYAELISFIKSFGLKVIVKLTVVVGQDMDVHSCCPLDPDYRNHVKDAVSIWLKQHHHDAQPDYLLWESRAADPRFFQHPKVRDATNYELYLAEIKLLENALNNRAALIALLPAQHHTHDNGKLLEDLVDDVGDNTVLAFHAQAQGAEELGSHPHPFWERLRKSPDVAATPLMPVLDVGCVSCGEGQWPVLSADNTDAVLKRMQRHHFIGILAIANTLPKHDSLLACSLWACGQAQWHRRPATTFAETWFAATYPQMPYTEIASLFQETRAIALKIQSVTSAPRSATAKEPNRKEVDAALLRIEALQASIKEIIASTEDCGWLAGAVSAFCRDSKLLLNSDF